MEQTKEYYAFISYKSEDKEWAIWLQHELEHYHLPATLNGRSDLPQELRPVFRDLDELSAGNLPEQIRVALANSANLIVVCSPMSAQSPWVNQEVETFIAMGKTKRIFPFIVEGHPYADNPDEECFPPAIRNLPKEEERLGGDVTKNGRDAAFVKVVAGMLELGFDTLWNRYEKEKAEEERRQREQRDNLLRVQSHYLAEKAMDVLDNGNSQLARLLALEALPKDLDHYDRPYVPAAEAALRVACESQSCIFRDPRIGSCAVFSPDGKLAAFSIDDTINIVSVETGVQEQLLQGHTECIWGVCFNHRGTLLASASVDSTVRIWDVKSGENLKTIKGHHDIVTTVSFNADDSMIVTGSYDGTVRFWDVKTGVEVLQLECPPEECPRKDSDEEVHTYAHFSPKGQFLAVKYHSTRRSTPIYVWHRKADNNGWEILTTTGNDWPYEYAFSYDEKYFVYDTDDVSPCKIRIIDLTNNQEYALFDANKDNWDVFAFAISHNGRLLAYSGTDNNIHIINFSSGEEIRQLKGHCDDINNLMFSPDDRLLLSSSDDDTVRFWELSPKPKYMSKHNLQCTSINSRKHLVAGSRGNQLIVRDFAPATSPCIEKVNDAEFFNNAKLVYGDNLKLLNHEGRLIHSSDTPVKIDNSDGEYYLSSSIWSTKLYNTATGEALFGLKDFDATFSLDGKWVLFSSWLYKDVWIYDLASHRKLHTFFPKPVEAAIFSADKNTILFSSDDAFYRVSINSLCFDIEIDYAGIASFSSDGSLLLMNSSKHIGIIDLTKPFETIWQKSFPDEVFLKDAFFSSNGEAIQYTYTDNEGHWHIRQCHVKDGIDFDSIDFEYHEPPESLLRFAPDNSKTASLNHFDCMLLDIDTNHVITLHHTRHLKDAVFSPDGSLLALACCDQAVHLWDVATGKEINVFRGHRGYVNKVIFTPDGKYIISASEDMNVWVWDVVSGTCIRELTGHTAAVTSVCISEDGQYIASSENRSKDAMCIWHLTPVNELIANTRKTHASRPLTEDERKKYNLEPF